LRLARIGLPVIRLGGRARIAARLIGLLPAAGAAEQHLEEAAAQIGALHRDLLRRGRTIGGRAEGERAGSCRAASKQACE
jgi:hypothetical protein